MKKLFILIVIILFILTGCNNIKTTDIPNGNQTTPKNNIPSVDNVTVTENQTSTLNSNGELGTDNEEVLFSFKTANSNKTLSVCISKSQPDYIVYRFGAKDKIELEFPENKDDSWSKFTYSYYLRGGEEVNEGMDLNYLSFENGGYDYQIYQEYDAKDNATNVGIKITDKATNKETDIKGLSDSIEGSLINLRENEKINTENMAAAKADSFYIEEVMLFVEAIKNNDADSFKSLVNSEGILIIRNFVSGGNGTRGKNIKDIYKKENIPKDLQFKVPDELPISPIDMFTETIKADFYEIKLKEIENDQLALITPKTETSTIIDMIAEILKESNNQGFEPNIIQLGSSGFVLAEAQLINDIPIGAFAIIGKQDNVFYLKAIIDLR